MALGETPDSTKIILEQKDLSDLTPEEKRREAQQFIINMHRFMMDRIKAFEGSPQEKLDFMDSMGKLEESFINRHTEINPLTQAVWDESRRKESSATTQTDSPLSERLAEARERLLSNGERLQAQASGVHNSVKLTVIEGGEG